MSSLRQARVAAHAEELAEAGGHDYLADLKARFRPLGWSGANVDRAIDDLAGQGRLVVRPVSRGDIAVQLVRETAE